MKMTFERQFGQQLEMMVAKLNDLDNNSRLLLRRVKRLEDQLDMASSAELDLSEQLVSSTTNSMAPNIFSKDTELTSSLNEWNSVNKILSSNQHERLISSLQDTLTKPVKRLQGSLSKFAIAYRSRNRMRAKLLKMQAKTRKLDGIKKTGPNLVKLSSAKRDLMCFEQELARRENNLMANLGDFFLIEAPVLLPSVEGFISAELNWIRGCEDTFETAAKTLINAIGQKQQRERIADIETTMRSIEQLNLN